MKSVLVSLATIPMFVFAGEASAQTTHYEQHNLIANKAAYKADSIDKKLINAWGTAIRPAGAGGHFWITGKDISFEYVGDVHASCVPKMQKLHVDGLKYVKLPVGGKEQFATGVVYLDSKKDFAITQEVAGVQPITAPAKFIFASDGGIISAWTERKKADGTFDRPTEALAMIDESAQGVQFFGLAVNGSYSRIYAANFGKNAGIKTYDGNFKPVDITFDQPFDTNKNGVVDPGEYAPFNIQALTIPGGQEHVFITYAKTRLCPKAEIKKGTCKAGETFPGEEDSDNAGSGRLAEFTENGKLVAVWNDGGKLNAPWGMAMAPSDFGSLSGTLLVSNFGDGTIAAFDPKTREFKDVMRSKDGSYLIIDKIWGLTFGNGVSLGDSNALYFAAGPKDEADGVFGSLRMVK